jgi:hypothetical protein
MNQKAEGTTSHIDLVREGAERSVRENGRTVIRFFGRGAAVDLGRESAKGRTPSEIVTRRRDGSVACVGRF